jgi:hypothetical protein
VRRNDVANHSGFPQPRKRGTTLESIAARAEEAQPGPTAC